jgi:hypothetical protein
METLADPSPLMYVNLLPCDLKDDEYKERILQLIGKVLKLNPGMILLFGKMVWNLLQRDEDTALQLLEMIHHSIEQKVCHFN